MAIIRWFTAVILSLLLTVSISVGIFSYITSEITAEDTLKPTISKAIQNSLEGVEDIQEFEKSKQDLRALCSIQESVTIPLDGLPEINIPCDEIEDLTPETFTDKIVDNLFEEYYYKSYDCDYFTCLRTLPAEQTLIFMLSNQANQYYKEIFRYSMTAIIILAISLIIITKNKLKTFRKFGWSLFFSGLPYFAIGYIKNQLAQSITTPDMMLSVQEIITPVFKIISDAYIKIFIIGVIFLLIGYFGVIFKHVKK